MFMTSQVMSSQPTYMVANSTSKINTVGSSINCNGTYLNSSDYYVYYVIKRKTTKEELLELAKDEVFFDEEDKKSAYNEIKRLSVEKKNNIFSYYD